MIYAFYFSAYGYNSGTGMNADFVKERKQMEYTAKEVTAEELEQWPRESYHLVDVRSE